MDASTTLPDFDETMIAALAERIGEVVYRKLRADILMGDDMLIEEAEVDEIFKRHPGATATMRKVGVGPQFVRIAGSKRRQYRIGAVKHYLFEVKAGPMHVTPFLEAAARVEAKWNGSRTAG